MVECDFVDKFLTSYEPGELIFQKGSTGSHMFVVSSGTVQIIKEAGTEVEVIATLGKGDIFGEMALIDNLPRSATAVAGDEGSQLLKIDNALFIYLVGQQPAFALIILKALSHRLRMRDTSGLPPVESEEAAADRSSTFKGDGVMQLQENIWQLRGKCMSYLVRGSRKNLLIDTGLPWETDSLELQLNSLGLTSSDIHLVVLTHEHLDHIGGVPHFSPSTVIAAHALAANKIGMQDEFVMMSKAFHLDVSRYHVDIRLHHGTCLDLGGTVLQVLHTPGHSSGAICLYDAERQIMFTGDTIFAGGILGGIFPSGSISDYTLTLNQLNSYRVKEFYPGHGRISKTPGEDFERAIKGSINLVNDTRSLFSALDSQEEFAQVSKAISTYSKRV